MEFGKVPRAIVGLYIESYSHYKSTFMKLRSGLKPAIPHDLDDLNFDGENIKYTQTTDKMPFLRYYCRDPGSKFLFFASNEGIKLLSDSKRWHSDGTFFAAPKPFKQEFFIYYIIHAYTSNGHMLPCAYFLTEKKDLYAIFIKKFFLH